MSALVLGVGNVLLRDEGIGIRAVEELERRYNIPDDVQVLDGGTSGIELLRFFDGVDHLIIVDAVRSGHPPGSVLRVEGEDVPATFETRITPHQLGLSDLLATAALSGQMPGYLVLFGVEPKTLETGLGFSPEVEGAIDKLIGHIAGELRRLGYGLEDCSVEKPCTSRFWGQEGEAD